MFKWGAWVLIAGWLAFIAVVALGFTFPKVIVHLFGPDNTYFILVLWLLMLLAGTFVYGLTLLFRLGMRRQPK
jgi:hypothetical protein